VDWLLLAAVLSVAGFLRLYRLESLPPGPYYDEAANGILAAEIASGVSHPLFITAYTGKEVLYFYLAASTMKALGISLLSLRLTSALAGVVTVGLTYWLALELFSEEDDLMRRSVALMAAALMAVSFWHVAISRYGFRAITQPLAQALTLLFLWRGWRLGHWRDLVLGGLFCGVTAYTYLASRAVPFALLPLLLGGLIVKRQRLGQRMGQVAIFLLSALAVFAPLGVYFMRNPEAFGVRMTQVSVFNPSLGDSNPWSALGQSAWKALGMFTVRGDPLWRFGVPGQPVFPALISILFYLGLLISAIRIFVNKDGLARVLHLSLLLWLPVMLVPSVLGANRKEVPSSLRAIGVMPVLYLFPAQGLAAMLVTARRWWQRIGEGFVIGVVAMVLLVGSATSVSYDYFAVWGRAPQPYYDNDNDLADAARTLNRVDLGERELFVSSIHYRHPTMAFMARSYARMRWLVGEQVMVFPPADGPGAVYAFPRSALPDETLLALLDTVADAERHQGPDSDIAYLIYHLPGDLSPSISPQYSLDADFGHQIELLGYDLAPAPAGESLAVTLYWRVLAPSEVGDYLIFAHLQDAWGFRWSSSGAFDYPSAEWAPGQIIVQRREVSVPAVAPPGDYALVVGFYSQGQDARLPRFDTQGRVAGTAVSAIAAARGAPDHPAVRVSRFRPAAAARL
jgi:4-amino-4-deoxy-L-arabinose transferase-like glycosyltransferase